jgi:hypothetical protein
MRWSTGGAQILNETASYNTNSKQYHLSMASVVTVRRVLRRLVTSVPDESDPSHGPQGDGNELATFQDFPDEKIVIIQEFLHESSLPPDQFIDAINEETSFDSDSPDSNDEWDGGGQFVVPGVKITKHPMRPPIHDFNRDDASEQAHLAFCELDITSEFQSVSSFREQIRVAVDYMRADGSLNRPTATM